MGRRESALLTREQTSIKFHFETGQQVGRASGSLAADAGSSLQ